MTSVLEDKRGQTQIVVGPLLYKTTHYHSFILCFIIGMDELGRWQNPLFSHLTCGVRAALVGNTKRSL